MQINEDRIVLSIEEEVHLPHISIAPPRTKWRPKVSCKSINKIYITKHQHLQVSLLGVFGKKLITNSFSL